MQLTEKMREKRKDERNERVMVPLSELLLQVQQGNNRIIPSCFRKVLKQWRESWKT
jgi:hypothetical protein